MHTKLEDFPVQATPPLTLRELEPAARGEAARLLGRGMCDNPVKLQAFRIPDGERRSQALARFFVPVLDGLGKRGLILGAFRNTTLVGVYGAAPPGRCQHTPWQKLRVFPSLVSGNPLRTPFQVLRWTGEWARRDLTEPHWHLGPVAVDAPLRGRGIGGAMMAEFCARMDHGRALSYLEPDRAENVRFYQRFGFVVIAEARVLGVPNWFMSRPAAPAAAGSRSV